MSSKIPYKKGKLFYTRVLKQTICLCFNTFKKPKRATHISVFLFLGRCSSTPKPPTHTFIFLFLGRCSSTQTTHTHISFFLFLVDAHQPKYANIHMVFAFEQMLINPKTIAKNTAKHLQIPTITSSTQAAYNKLWAKCQYVKLESYLCSLKIQYRDRKVRSN